MEVLGSPVRVTYANEVSPRAFIRCDVDDIEETVGG